MVEWYWQEETEVLGEEDQCHFVHHKSYRDGPEIEAGSQRWQADDWPRELYYNIKIAQIIFKVPARTAQKTL